jgi:hypothetical protein
MQPPSSPTGMQPTYPTMAIRVGTLDKTISSRVVVVGMEDTREGTRNRRRRMDSMGIRRLRDLPLLVGVTRMRWLMGTYMHRRRRHRPPLITRQARTTYKADGWVDETRRGRGTCFQSSHSCCRTVLS